MLENMKNVRLARLRGEEHADVKTITGLNRDALDELMNRTRWTVTV